MNGARLRLLGGLFVLTGATALLVEQAFEKLLSTLLGASTPAAATVLAVYFGGLTLGGVLYGKIPPRVRAHPLRLYAGLELCVGTWALLLALSFDKLIPLFVPLLARGADHFWVLQALRLAAAACWILPATVPMGATFPAIVDALERLQVTSGGQAIARFYSWNLLGAILGAVLGPFLAFPYLGVDGTLGLGFCLNATVALVAFRISRGVAAGPTLPATTAPVIVPPRTIIGLAFSSGFVFFALEVVWAHLIGAVLGNSVYAFAAMLAVVLVGLGIGGALTTRFAMPVAELARLVLVGAIVLALINGFWPDVPQVLAALGANVTSFAVAEALRWLLAAVMILPAAITLGMIYPSLFRLELFPTRAQGAAAGRLVAANALGCISGALVCGFGLIPWLGSQRTLTVLTGTCVGWGILLAVRVPQRRLWLYAAASVVALILQPRWNRLNLTSGRHVYFRYAEVAPESQLRFFHEDTCGGITTVADNPAGTNQQPRPYRTLLTNGKFQGNDSWEMDAQAGLALVPMLFVPQFDNALVIGLGTGHSAHIVNAMGFARIDIAELAPGIVQAAREHFAHINGRVLDQPHVRLFLEDGRNALLLRPQQYDLITMEISSVWFAGSTNLYSEEFYRLARARLKPGGVFQQWIQLHHIGMGELLSVFATMRSVFPHVSLWVVGGQGVLVGTAGPQEIQPGFLAALPARGSTIGWTLDNQPAKLARLIASRLLAPEDLNALTGSGHIVPNTDRNRHLEYFTPRYNYSPRDLRRENVVALAVQASYPAVRLAPGASGPLAEACRQVTAEQYRQRFGL